MNSSQSLFTKGMNKVYTNLGIVVVAKLSVIERAVYIS